MDVGVGEMVVVCAPNALKSVGIGVKSGPWDGPVRHTCPNVKALVLLKSQVIFKSLS